MPFLTDRMGKTARFIMGFCIYWFTFCLPISLYSVNGIDKLMKMYAQKSNCSTIKKRLYLLAFIPSTCIGAFFTVFQETALFTGASVKGLALFLH